MAKRHRKVGFHCGLEQRLICMVHGSFGGGSCAPWFCTLALSTLCRCKSFEIDFALCCFGWGGFFGVGVFSCCCFVICLVCFFF